ncbi:MAG: DUF1801 domain-containing protein [Lachnospiraceae bacterium]|nr:DUF1801 domain-containing protein [Lachnospiraceae bacterium]
MWTCPNCGREFKRTNQSHYCGNAPASVDEYISQQVKDIQPILVSLKNTINEAIPDAEETIAWSTPTWKKKGNIIRFAVSKNHIGVYVWEDAVSFFEERLRGIETDNGVIRLKIGEEMPLSLIADIATWCFAMDQRS